MYGITIVPPTIFPTPLVMISVVVLGLSCTAVARVLHFELIQNIGPTGAGLTTHLAPAFGIFWSWLFLAELPNTGTFLGLGLILGGVTLMTLHSRLPKKAISE